MAYNPGMRFVSLSGLFLLVMLAACSAATPTPSITPDPTREPVATRTPLPTITPRPSFTPQATFPATGTPPPLPTVDPALAEVQVAGLSWLPDYNLLVSLDFPGPVHASAYRVTLEDNLYACEIIAEYPNRLYCHGPGQKLLGYATLLVYPAESNLAGFEEEISIPYFDNSNYEEVP